jgi:hypothetical protein
MTCVSEVPRGKSDCSMKQQASRVHRGVGFLRPYAWAIALATLPACSGSVIEDDVAESVEATTTVVGGTVQFDLPDGFAPEAVALGANGQLSINDRARVYGSVGGMGLVVNTGTGTSDLGADASVGELLGGGAVSLRERSIVARNVQAGGPITQQNNVTVGGSTSARAPLKPGVNRSWLVAFADSASSVTLNSGQTQTLAPGTFANVTVNAGGKLTLRAGTYNIGSLKLEPQSTLTLDGSAGAIVVNVRSELVFRGTVPNRQAAAPKALFAYFGSTLVSVDAPFAGTLVAPNATVKLESLNGATHYGAFFGKNVELHQGGNVVHTPFASWSSLPFVNDGVDAVAGVPADASIARIGTNNVTTYSLKAPLLLDLANLPIRKVSTLPGNVEINFGGNVRCAQRLGLPGLDCIDFPPPFITPIPVLIVRRPFTDSILRTAVDLRNIFKCSTDVCPFSSAGMFQRAGGYEAVKRQMKWQFQGAAYDLSSDAIKKAWVDWSDDPAVIPNKRDFLLALNDASSWLAKSDRFTNFRGQPDSALTATGDGAETETDDNGSPRYFIKYEDAWRLYTWWIAHNVAVDLRREVPWRLDDLATSDETLLAPLFDSTEMMHRRLTGDVGLGGGPHNNYHDKPWSSYHGWNIIGTPRFTYRFLVQNDIIQSSRLTSIESMLDWGGNMAHFFGSATRSNALAHWGHRYFPTVEKIIEGTTLTGESSPRHWTMGCHGTAFFMKDVLRAINIPVRVPFICGHAEIAFVSEGLFVDHADDPYNSNYTGSQCTAEHLLIDAETFASRFGRQVNHDDAECYASPNPVAFQVTDEGISVCQ